MINKKVFLELYKKNLDKDGKLSQKEVSAIDLFLDFVNGSFNLLSISQWAYVFATVFHETAFTFEPITEAYWLSEEWRKKNLRYYPYHGRGYVQITWKKNYQIFSSILGEDLVKNPDLAKVPKYAFKILVKGFINGIFTGKKISDYINTSKKDYKGARRCINGTDKAQIIANYATLFEQTLAKSSNINLL